ncbi:MAG TPA: hypothetical protein VJU16_06695, partial [Planctomycetota bacterium]|nr:hypothetical protein [Planctomycetota bacterium]
MSFIADNVSAGLDPLQDVDKEMDIAFRTVRQGCRVLRRDDVGDLIIDRNAIGDIHGWVLWNQVPNGRPCPAFAQVWPARVASAAGGGRDTVTGADMFGILPITTFFDYDTRYGVKTPLVGRANPGRRQRAWNRAPRGQVGIIVSTTNEYDLDELFLPTDPRMIAPNIRGDGAC